MRIDINNLKEGMLSNQTICDSQGVILIAQGVKLTKNIIARLRKFKIQVIGIKDDIEYGTLEQDISEEKMATKENAEKAAVRAMSVIGELAASIDDNKTLLVKKNFC
jgi:hypothetical protein